jgi:hypothetical protein
MVSTPFSLPHLCMVTLTLFEIHFIHAAAFCVAAIKNDSLYDEKHLCMNIVPDFGISA